MIFETHAHYDDKVYDEDREELLLSMKENGIGTIVNVSAAVKDIPAILEMTKKYPFVYATTGVHPSEVGALNDETFKILENATKEERVVAVGEIGLDYYYPDTQKDLQKEWFLKQLSLARTSKLPIIIHSRDASKDTMDIIKSEKAYEMGGVIHCYSYSLETAKEYLDMGFYLGIGGVVTFKKSKVLKEVVEYMPLDRILLETDCPYLSPEPHRGTRNSSLNIPYIVKEIARLKNTSEEEIIKETEKNALKMYRIQGE